MIDARNGAITPWISVLSCALLAILINANSLATIALSVISDTFSTSICLLSCFVSCSKLCRSLTSTTNVILEIRFVSELPTEILSMLNCRLYSIPVIRFRTPLRSCTLAIINRFILRPLSFHECLYLGQSLGKHKFLPLLYNQSQPASHMRMLPSAPLLHLLLSLPLIPGHHYFRLISQNQDSFLKGIQNIFSHKNFPAIA